MSGKYLIRAPIVLADVGIACGQEQAASPQSGATPSTGATYTWVDSTGKNSYQTGNPNANTNGTLTGNWTRQQQVHGDGTGK